MISAILFKFIIASAQEKNYSTTPDFTYRMKEKIIN